ncbi:MAG TPA: DUF4870 domain-containing protein [Tahibacter sp.]|uniref:DUF4870 domain-containing protein n=1 Tax=Tahibacter sp. TaxID=2056211 RepID=UPI002BDD7ED0|nr:DUF4870 domain-containing protein [Tahibacter sp.]HSX61751.1 DUF4870 domain-containing protein [Tahibacter sp.]
MSTPSDSPDMLPPNDLPPPPPSAPPPGVGPTQEERQWAMFAHLSSLLGALVTGGFGVFIGPLVIWLIKKETMPFVDDQGKEALNFNITLAILGVALLILTVITFGIGALLTLPVALAAAVAWLVLTVIASIKASEGVNYRYPLSLRLIK